MNVVLDTNCLLMSLSRRSSYYPVWRDFVDGKYTLCVTNEILAEYEEILSEKVGAEIASNVIKAILDLPNTRMVQVFFHLRLIAADPDDDNSPLLASPPSPLRMERGVYTKKKMDADCETHPLN